MPKGTPKVKTLQAKVDMLQRSRKELEETNESLEREVNTLRDDLQVVMGRIASAKGKGGTVDRLRAKIAGLQSQLDRAMGYIECLIEGEMQTRVDEFPAQVEHKQPYRRRFSGYIPGESAAFTGINPLEEHRSVGTRMRSSDGEERSKQWWED